MNEREIFLRAKDVAARLGVKPGTVWKWAREGKLVKPMKLSPKCSVWKVSDIEKFQQAA